MKYVLIALGIILLLLSSASLYTYMNDYERLSEYGKGYVWGSIFQFLAGVGLIFWAWRIGKTSTPR